jgi:pyrroline-5-carboxylate reductase
MPIPTYEEMMLSILQALSDRQEKSVRDLADIVSSHFQLTEEERGILIPSQPIRKVNHRTNWAKPEHIMVAEPLKNRHEHIKGIAPGVSASHSNLEAAEFADIVVLSVKPQILLKIVEEVKPALTDSKLVISVAAGVTTTSIERKLGGKVSVVRAMPNIAAVVREAATAICPGKYATEEHLTSPTHIFESVGTVVEVEEALMDAVTRLSGTGPMYGFQILEGLSDAGVKVGLSRDVASALAVQTLIGSSKLIQETKEHPAKLKGLVTSPGGAPRPAPCTPSRGAGSRPCS